MSDAAHAFLVMLLAMAGAPAGPFPWLKNRLFEPVVFLGSNLIAVMVMTTGGPW